MLSARWLAHYSGMTASTSKFSLASIHFAAVMRARAKSPEVDRANLAKRLAKQRAAGLNRPRVLLSQRNERTYTDFGIGEDEEQMLFETLPETSVGAHRLVLQWDLAIEDRQITPNDLQEIEGYYGPLEHYKANMLARIVEQRNANAPEPTETRGSVL
ncbi:hypothetical protein BC835DRAFT_1415183 [Cytidiella melzeri]|nr:hypothetical protein BC835DRAFT_1415183 [Cytidiella melzeri]